MNSRAPRISFAPNVKVEHKRAVDSYIKQLEESGRPVILSVKHLSQIVKVKTEELYAISNAPDNYYRNFKVRKHNGGKRDISAPLPLLLYLQQWILENILEVSEVHPAAKAYKKKSSIKENAKFHRRQRYVFKSDVVDFFGSISGYWAHNFFLGLGYTKAVSAILSGICTRSKSLPQGAATSGYLSNIYMLGFDEELFTFCRQNKLRYTRYADDIAISGSDLEYEAVKNQVSDSLQRIHLKTNLSKTRCIGRHARQKITGVVVNEKLSPGRIFLRELRKDLHYIDKYGIYGHARHIGWQSPLSCLSNVRGRLSHALFLLGDDKELSSQKKKLDKIMNQLTH